MLKIFIYIYIALFFSTMVNIALPTYSYAQKRVQKSKEELKIMEERRLKFMIKNLEANNYAPFEHAVRSFEEMEEDAIPHLTKVLRSNDYSHKAKMNAIYTLGRIGKIAKPAVPVMLLFLRKEDSDIKAITAIALGKIGKGASDAVPQLSQLLFSEEKWVVESAYRALKAIGTKKAQNTINEFNKLQKRKGTSSTK